MSINNFNSQENKSVLWQFLIENNLFDGISTKKFDKVVKMFESNIESVSSVNDTISNKNKIVIQKMIDGLNFLKTKNLSKPLEEVKLEIESDLKLKEEEFEELIKKPKPKNLEFNDEKDEPISNENMEIILQKMLKDRNLELNNESNIVTKDDEELLKEKRVTFVENDFISKLKRTNDDVINNDHINDMNDIINSNKFKTINKSDTNEKLLLKILENQEKILKHLNI
jgi:hypothetical protein